MSLVLIRSLFIVTTLLLLMTRCSNADGNAGGDDALIEFNAMDTLYTTKETVRRTYNEPVEFSYRIDGSIEHELGELIRIEYSIKNTGNKDVYYLASSCNGLDYYLKLDPVLYEIDPLMYCNASYPIIHTIKKGSTLRFFTNLRPIKSSTKEVKIGVDLRTVDRFIEFSLLREHGNWIEKVFTSPLEEKDIVWSPDPLPAL